MGGNTQVVTQQGDVLGPGFLGLPAQCTGPSSTVWVLPVPYEATTTYGSGARGGPDAIVSASRQVEYYDREMRSEPAHDYGIHTLPAPDLTGLPPAAAIASIADAVARASDPTRLLCVLGGEHGASIGVARGLRRVHGNFVAVQLDAHADLRDSYENTPLSHASAARRIIECGSPVFQLGIRSLDITEAAFIDANPSLVTSVDIETMRARGSWRSWLTSFVRDKDVYLTIDIDALDPSIVPATGTPEPDGLHWNELLDVIRIVVRAGHVIAFDCVELAPYPGLHHADFAAAKLVYKTMNLIMASPSWQTLSRKNRGTS